MSFFPRSPASLTAPPPRYARQALVKSAPLSPVKFEITSATAMRPANTPVAITTIAIPTDIDILFVAFFRTSFSSRITLP